MATNQSQNRSSTGNKDENELNRRKSNNDVQNALYGENYIELRDAIERLYVFGNMSGRLIFQKNWPVIADQIFDEQLQKYDTEGAISEDDRKERAALEEDADIKREEFATLFTYMDQELVNDGTVDLEKLEFVMQKLDRETCLLLFAERFVDRFHAPPAQEATKANGNENGNHKDNNGNGHENTHAPDHDDTMTVEDSPTGNIHLPPPASKPSGTNSDYKEAKRPLASEETPSTHIPEHIGHADHSLSQTLTANQHKETDLFSDNYIDPLDDVMPIDMGGDTAQTPPTTPPQDSTPDPTTSSAQAPDTNAPDDPSSPDAIAAPAADNAPPYAPPPASESQKPSEQQTQIAPETPEQRATPQQHETPAAPAPADPPKTEPEQSAAPSVIKPIAPKARLEKREENKPQNQGWTPGPGIIVSETPLDEEDDKPLFVSNVGLSDEPSLPDHTETPPQNNETSEQEESADPHTSSSDTTDKDQEQDRNQ